MRREDRDESHDGERGGEFDKRRQIDDETTTDLRQRSRNYSWKVGKGRVNQPWSNLRKSSLFSHIVARRWFYFIFPHHILEVSSICGLLSFMTRDAASQRSPPLEEY